MLISDNSSTFWDSACQNPFKLISSLKTI